MLLHFSNTAFIQTCEVDTLFKFHTSIKNKFYDDDSDAEC
jgi:hypothetical protein